mmetsp:Transcript_43149/g.111151  ORF Transcript_43149/g.111151 Transcript_43149/m.111151 type:complete len:685 (-) Transcript_43149:46-2100(-)
MFGFAFINLWFLTTFRDFNNALHDKDKDKFYDLIYRICVVALAIMPVSAARDALKGSLALEWRRYLTNTLMSKYIGDSQAFYRLKLHGCDLDNPDQRIAQDTGEFTGALLHFTTVVMQACIVILTQSGMLMAISPELFLFVVAYCLIMNVVTFVVFGGRLTAVNRSVLAQEASLRFGLVRVRENAEPIAFYQGAAFEKARCGEFFAELMSTLYAKMCLMVTFESFQATMGLFVSVLPYMVVAGKYLAGDLDFGAMSEAAAVLAALERSFNTMVSQMERMSSMGAQAVRIQQIWEVLDHISEVHEGKYSDDGALLERGGEMGARGVSLVELPADSLLRADVALLRLEDITLQPPLGQVALVHDLSFELKSGDSLLVCGPSGIGKSSLLRAIGGLWASGQGSIERCASSQCFFVPQEPYLCLGSLRENATYPGSFTAGGASSSSAAQSPTDAEIRAALADVNISYLLERFDLDEAVDLDTVLSGGERQRLGFARLLLRPAGLRFAIMDEATSALDAENEGKVQQSLDELMVNMAGSCSVMLIAHRLSTVMGADKIVVLDQGRVVEQGTHGELLENGHIYAQLVQRQLARQANTLPEDAPAPSEAEPSAGAAAEGGDGGGKRRGKGKGKGKSSSGDRESQSEAADSIDGLFSQLSNSAASPAAPPARGGEAGGAASRGGGRGRRGEA